MNNSPKAIVLRKHNKMSLDVLRSYQADVVSATVNNPAYTAVKPAADEVEVKGSAFDKACAAAANGGKPLTEERRKAKQDLLVALDKLGNALQASFDGDFNYFTNAHFDYRRQPVKGAEPLPDPQLEFVVPGVLSGTVQGKVRQMPKGVKAIAIEYQEVGTTERRNGTYSTGMKFTLGGLEPRKEYSIRVVYHGTQQRTSNPSDEMKVFVL